MAASPARSNDRIVLRALLVCIAFGVLVLVMIKVLSKPPPAVVDVPVKAPEIAQATPSESASTQRESAPKPDLEPTPVLSTPARANDGKVALVRGKVLGRRVGPVANARVSFEFERGTETGNVGHTTTDAKGEYAFSSDALAAHFGTDAMLRIDAEAEGYQPGSAHYILKTCSADLGIQADVTVTPGARILGRVVDADRAPVPGAIVTLLVANMSGSVKTFVAAGTAKCNSYSGEFRLGFASSGEYRITARAEDVGTAVMEKLELEAGAERRLDDIVLAGGAPIWGRVVATGGEPVPYFELWAIDGGYANEVDALARATLRVPADERDDGLSLTKTSTDPQGNFLLKGLRPGQYALRSPDRQVVLEPHQLRYEPGTKNVELVVSSQRLLVHVVRPVQSDVRYKDAKGVRPATSSLQPVKGAGVRITDLSTLPDGSYQASNTRTQAVNDKTGVAAFTLDPEAPVAVQAFDGRRVSAEEIVILAQNEWTRELTLTLSDETGKGRVRFDVLGEDGLPLTHLRIAALSSVTKIGRDDLGALETDDNGVLSALPVGSYHFVIGYAQGTDRDHFVVRTSDPVVVREKEETIVSLRARRGGRLRIALDLRGTPPPGYADNGKLTPEERRDRFGARVTLTPAAGGVGTALVFRPVSGPGLVGSLLLGESLLSDVLLERGTYDVTIESSAFKLASPLRTVVEPGAAGALVVAVAAR